MKLILCSKCHDVVALHFRYRECLCGASGGRYEEDGRNAVITPAAIPLGFGNGSFSEAVRHRPHVGEGKRFLAFVIPRTCGSVRYAKKDRDMEMDLLEDDDERAERVAREKRLKHEAQEWADDCNDLNARMAEENVHILAEEFDRRFDEGEDITPYLKRDE